MSLKSLLSGIAVPNVWQAHHETALWVYYQCIWPIAHRYRLWVNYNRLWCVWLLCSHKTINRLEITIKKSKDLFVLAFIWRQPYACDFTHLTQYGRSVKYEIQLITTFGLECNTNLARSPLPVGKLARRLNLQWNTCVGVAVGALCTAVSFCHDAKFLSKT